MKHLLSNHNATTLGPLFAAKERIGTLRENKGDRELADGKDLKEKGLQLVRENNDNWMERAIKSVRQYLHYGWYGDDFTGEDIRLACELEVGHPKHQNAYGALINTLIKRKIIVPTGEYRPMKDKTSHARSTPVYKAP